MPCRATCVLRPWSALLPLLIFCLCGPAVGGHRRALTTVQGQSRPNNVLVIVVDDLGWTDLGCYGSRFYETPHVDALAASGVRFTQAYATCPVCSPTRVSIMTGRYPQRSGLTDYAGAPQPDAWKRPTALLPAPYREHLPVDEVTMGDVFRAAGYDTFFAGKWHLGGEGFLPTDQGFAINRGGWQWGHPRGGNKYFSPYGNPRLEDGPEGEYLPERMAAETKAFIEQPRDKPFLAVLCFYVVHTPLMTRPELEARYQQKRENLDVAGPEFIERDGRRVRQIQNHAVYAGMVEAMDTATGEVLQALETAGVADDTLVIFTSDNGGLSTSEGHPTSNLPLRAGKGWMYEGGIRVPLIMRAPGKVSANGAISDVPVSSNDILPTAMDFAGLQPGETAALDGASLLQPERIRSTNRNLYWHYPHYGNQGGQPSQAVRSGDWKLIRFFGEARADDRSELYNLATDLGENHNVADRHPEIRTALERALNQWSRDVGVQYPSARK